MTDTLIQEAVEAACEAYDVHGPDEIYAAPPEAMEEAIKAYLKALPCEIPGNEGEIERVAEALYVASLSASTGQMSWENVAVKFPDTADEYRRKAKTAIGAMRREAQPAEIPGNKDMATLCHYVLGHTPDRYTQTPEEVEITLEHIDAIARKYLGQHPLPVSEPKREISKAEVDVVKERARQIKHEGYPRYHDDVIHAIGHHEGEIALAAAPYCLSASADVNPLLTTQVRHKEFSRKLWPWEDEEYKPKNARRDLVRAAALLLAEIERLDRKNPTKIDSGKS